MEELLIYLIKSALTLVISVSLFMLLMSRETFHRFNRILLLTVSIFSLTMPLISININSPFKRISTLIETFVKGDADTTVATNVSQPIIEEIIATPTHFEASSEIITLATTAEIAAFIYIAVALLLTLRLIYMYAQVACILRKGKAADASHYTDTPLRMRIHNQGYAPFSFFGWISISESDMAEGGRQIITHEAAHVKYRHSWDILFADLLIILQWFNPIAWVTKSLLKEIHEFEADEAVISSGVDAKQYQLLIIKKAVGSRLYSIANSFNHSLTSKRITMMCKKKSNQWHIAKALYFVPVAVIAACTFSSPSGDKNSSGLKGSEKNVNLATDNVQNVATEANPTTEESRSSNDPVFQVVEQQPTFPGGLQEAMKYLQKNIKYPEEAKSEEAEGKVYVRFTVETDGSIGEVGVMKSSGNEHLDAEAVRVVTAMPKWEPGKQGGKVVRVRMVLPVAFAFKPENSSNTLPEVTTIQYSIDAPPTDEVYQVVEQMPEFPGGMKELMGYLSRSIKYPAKARQENKMGKSHISFVVEKDGSISDVTVAKSSGNQELDEESLRVVKSMPKWNPGKQSGKAVRVRFTLPITFRLQ